ncbi:MAG TPA: glycoside hydrolase family 3, partial [Bacteroidaceae bacterium]|nr:glycoside hydrolase family 3 [Bacteroidaceae bacterium]
MRNTILQVVIAIFSLILFNNFHIDNKELNRKFVPVFSEDPAFISVDSSWADSVLYTLSLEEKIGQMIMMPAYSNRSSSHRDELLKIIKKDKIGGILFFQGGPVRQAQMTNCFQQESCVPLLIAIDGEWGLGMRLDSVISYPRQMILGAVQDNDLVYRMGFEIAEQMKQLGIHMNFAPVADINNNPENPVINSRSFGDNRYNVAEKVIAYFSGMQNNGLLVTAKHFPGHGDTDTDSHLTLPVLNHSKQRLDSLELFPFRESFSRGLSGVMVGHLHVPALDDSPGRPSTLSWNISTGLLVEQMGFKGLIVT